jgi:hypothetical protein
MRLVGLWAKGVSQGCSPGGLRCEDSGLLNGRMEIDENASHVESFLLGRRLSSLRGQGEECSLMKRTLPMQAARPPQRGGQAAGSVAARAGPIRATNRTPPTTAPCSQHNQDSIEQAVQEMHRLGLPPTGGGVYFGQLLGMADSLTFTLGQNGCAEAGLDWRACSRTAQSAMRPQACARALEPGLMRFFNNKRQSSSRLTPWVDSSDHGPRR